MICYTVTLGILGWLGYQLHMSWPFYGGLLGAAGIFGLHYTWIRGRERMPCFRAFLHNNYAGAAIFIGIVLSFLIR
jgi:4-hydroxybenzoate polyprenyltransferase